MTAARAAPGGYLPKLLRLNAREHGDEVALREKDLGLWRVVTWSDYQARVRDFALGMLELGVEAGDVVALIGDNRPDWLAGEIAIHAIGAMSLGVYRDALDGGSRLSAGLRRGEARIRRGRGAGRQAARPGRARARPARTSSIAIRAACASMPTRA